ncbi:MAG TPA: hypothetical protein VII99_11835 [Bacteroidia bacterium]
MFLLYGFYLHIKPFRLSQSQWQGNIIKAQSYLYDTVTPGNLLVGSSLAAELIPDSMPGICNLAFSGQSIYDGIRLAEFKKQYPKNIFIEMNVAFKKEDKNFTSLLCGPLPFYLKKQFPQMREQSQPVSLLGVVFTVKLFSAIDHFFHKPTPAASSEMNEPNALFTELLNAQKKAYSEPLPEDFTTGGFAELKQQVNRLAEHHTKIIFFEMPVDTSLRNLPRAKKLREMFYQAFPPSNFNYILPTPDVCETKDGVHLSYAEAQHFSAYINDRIKKISETK